MKNPIVRNTVAILLIAIGIVVFGVVGIHRVATAAPNSANGLALWGFTAAQIPFGRGDTRGSLNQDAGLSWNNTSKTLTATNVSSSGTDTAAGIYSTDNITASTAGKGLRIKTGSNARMGQATLSSGKVTVSNTSVTSNTMIYLTAVNSTAKFIYEGDQHAGVDFDIYGSDASDSTTKVNWILVEPAP